MRSSPPARSPKFQLAVEQPSTGGCWNPPKKDIPCPKTKKLPQQDGRWGCNHDKIKFHTCQVVTHRLENNNKKRKSHTIVKVLNPTLGFPDWRSDKGTKNPHGIWPWGPVGFDYRPSRGLRETDSGLGGHKQNLCPPWPRGEEQWPHWRLNQNHLLVLEGLLWRRGSAGAHHRDRGTGRSPLWTLLEFAINPTTGSL